MKLNVKALVGVEGVSPKENARAVRVGRYFSYAVLVALVVITVQLVLGYADYHTESIWVSALVWGVFTTELLVNLTLVDNKKRYLRNNWLNVVIILLLFPWIEYGGDWAAIFRSLRLVLFLRVFSRILRDVVALLNRHNLGKILLIGLAFILFSGAVVAVLEDIDFFAGVWYALVTVTTVGYGDVVPQSTYGQFFAMILIVFGVVLFSLLTANISAYLVDSDYEKSEKELLAKIDALEEKIALQAALHESQNAKLLSQLSEKLEAMEKRLEASYQSNKTP